MAASSGQSCKIGFAGAGKVGASFGRHISENGGEAFTVAGYCDRDPVAAQTAASFAGGAEFENIAALTAACDVLLLTVPDGEIAHVWKEASAFAPKIVAHCSGSQSSEVFSQGGDGISFGSLHPVIAVPNRDNGYEKLRRAYFTAEGDKSFTDFASELLRTLGNPFAIIDRAHKTAYHAACVTVSNFVCALAYMGEEAFKKCGLEKDFAENAWRTLFLENALSIAELGPVRALTGPVERNDAETLARHLEALSGDRHQIYLFLSRILTDAAKQKNPSCNYSETEKLLKVSP